MALSVLIVMGSDSDLEQITPAWKVLESLGVRFEVAVASAHRSPDRVVAMARSARENGFGVILAPASSPQRSCPRPIPRSPRASRPSARSRRRT